MTGAPMEWSLEQARQCWRPMSRAVQHVGVPGYQFQVGVMWDGALVFGPLWAKAVKDRQQENATLQVMRQEIAPLGDPFLHVSFGYGERLRLVDRRGTNSPLIRRRLEQGRLPIPHVATSDGDLTWTETVFAHLLGRRAAQWLTPQDGDTLITHVVFQVRNNGPAKRTGHLWMHFGDSAQVSYGTAKCEQLPNIGQEIPCRFAAPFGRLGAGVRFVIPKPNTGRLVRHAAVEQAQGIGGTPRQVIEWQVPLAAGAAAELRLIFPYGVVRPAVARKLAELDSASQLAEVVGFWKKLQYGRGQIRTPDPFVNDYLVAVAGQMAQQVAYRAESRKAWLYKTSPNHYEAYWPCNAAKALPAFDLRGLTDLSRHVLQGFIAAQTENVGGLNRDGMGAGQVIEGEGFAAIPGFLGNFGGWTGNPLLISHGLGLWALASHYRITRDMNWLGSGPRSPLQAMLAGFDWVTQQRQRTMRKVDGKRVPQWGLLPAASAHDWLAGSTIFNDAFCVYGMTEVVRLLREIKHRRAEETATELHGYCKCLHDRYAEARDRARRLPLPDGTTIPFVPRMVQELDWAKLDWTYTGYGPLRVGAWGGFDPHDELVDQALAYLEAGMPKGEGYYFASSPDTAQANFADISDPKAERHYLWRHYVEGETMWPIGGPLFLERDDLPRFFEWLFHNLAVAIHQDFRVGVEMLDGVPSTAPGDAERWQVIRRMFINESGGYAGSEQSLWLLQAIPRSWLRPGDRMCVKDMGTWFGGKVDLDVRVADDGNSVMVDAKLADLAVLPQDIVMRLRSGDGRPLRSATINGRAVRGSLADTIRLPRRKAGRYRIVGRW